MEENPYAAPLADEDVLPTPLEAIRRKYLHHEASIRSIGTLYYLPAAFLMMTSIMIALTTLRGEHILMSLALAIAVLALAIGFAALARSIRRLDPRCKVPLVILSCIGLLALGPPTVINGYFLYLVLCEKGTFVLSPNYQEIVRQTPHIKYRTSPIAIAALLTVLGMIALAVVIGVMDSAKMPRPR